MNIKKEMFLTVMGLSLVVAFTCIMFATRFDKRLVSKPKAAGAANTAKDIATKDIATKDIDIAVIMLTSHHTASHRLPVMRMLYETEKEKDKAQVDTFYVTDRDLALPKLAPWRQMIATGCDASYTGGLCCKLRFAYTQLFTQKYKWVLRVVDDGFVDYANLLAYTRSLNSSEPLYLGEYYHHGHLGARPYADGGAGWLMSRPALALAVPLLSHFFQNGPDSASCYDDVQFGRFMIDTVKLEVKQGKGMHNEFLTIRDGQLWLSPRHAAFHGEHVRYPIITWHSDYNGSDFSHLQALQAFIRSNASMHEF